MSLSLQVMSQTNKQVFWTNTGALQGCVISPVLFTLYTNDCVSTHDSYEIIKYADDTAILGKLSINPVRHADYLNCITDFTDWCTANFLELNVSKTKELIFDFRRSQCPVQPVTIGTDTVEIVNEYKYLGTIIDNQLNWSSNIRQLFSKCQQRLYFLRKLNEFHIDHTIMHLFYTSVIQSIFAFCILVYYGNASSRDIHKVHRIIKQAQKLTQCQCQSIHEIYNIMCTRKVRLIVGDEAHPLHQFYSKLRSGIRFKSMRGRTNIIRSCINYTFQLPMQAVKICWLAWITAMYVYNVLPRIFYLWYWLCLVYIYAISSSYLLYWFCQRMNVYWYF